MKLVKLYEDILREGEAESCIAKFGRELFDPQLKVDGEPSNIEPNTDIETKYLNAIIDFTKVNHGNKLNDYFIQAINDLKKCASMYPEVLEPFGTAYRGTTLTMKQLLNHYDDIADVLSQGGDFSINYTPKSPIQSWAADKDVAEDFSTFDELFTDIFFGFKKVRHDPDLMRQFVIDYYPKVNEINCPVTISLNTSKDDFLFKSKYFSQISRFGGENELLRVTNKPTTVTCTIIEEILPTIFEFMTQIRKYEHTK
jgi:hypothetical protein